jgi:hypothetical protein
MNKLANNGETADPYEQRWVMCSAWRLPLVGAVAVVGRCA